MTDKWLQIMDNRLNLWFGIGYNLECSYRILIPLLTQALRNSIHKSTGHCSDFRQLVDFIGNELSLLLFIKNARSYFELSPKLSSRTQWNAQKSSKLLLWGTFSSLTNVGRDGYSTSHYLSRQAVWLLILKENNNFFSQNQWALIYLKFFVIVHIE